MAKWKKLFAQILHDQIYLTKKEFPNLCTSAEPSEVVRATLDKIFFTTNQIKTKNDSSYLLLRIKSVPLNLL